MTIKRLLITSIIGSSIIFGFNGCTNNNSLTMEKHGSLKKGDFIKYNNMNHIIGNKDNAIKTLSYVKKTNNKITTKVTFYIDKFPYVHKFNLCQDMKDNKILSSVETTNNIDKLTFKDYPINCNGYIEVSLFREDLFGNFKIKSLKGFNVDKLKNYDILLKEINVRAVQNTNFKEKSSNYNYLNNIYEENFWIIK